MANVARYRANRDSLVASLTAAGITKFVKPQGAFYCYADVGHLTNDSQQFCKRLLAETGVAITPGVDFDPQRGARTVRLSFAGSRETIDEAGARVRIKSMTKPPNLADIEGDIEKLSVEKDEAVKAADYERAAELRDKAEQLRKKKEEIQKSWRNQIGRAHV